MSGFFTGQRVLCIDGKFHPSVWDWVNEIPLEGEVHTAAWIRARGHYKLTGKIGPALALKEVSGTLMVRVLMGTCLYPCFSTSVLLRLAGLGFMTHKVLPAEG